MHKRQGKRPTAVSLHHAGPGQFLRVAVASFDPDVGPDVSDQFQRRTFVNPGHQVAPCTNATHPVAGSSSQSPSPRSATPVSPHRRLSTVESTSRVMEFRRSLSKSRRKLLLCTRLQSAWSKRWKSRTMALWPAAVPQSNHRTRVASRRVVSACANLAAPHQMLTLICPMSYSGRPPRLEPGGGELPALYASATVQAIEHALEQRQSTPSGDFA